MNACVESREWADAIKTKTNQEAWDTCEHADWMVWLLKKVNRNPSIKTLMLCVKCACEFTKSSFRYPTTKEKRLVERIQIVEQWLNGDKVVLPFNNGKVYTVHYSYSYAAAATKATVFAAHSVIDTIRNPIINARNVYDSTIDAAVYSAKAASAFDTNMPTFDRKARIECATILRKYFPKAPRIMKVSAKGC